jgi:hypothetical protein
LISEAPSHGANPMEIDVGARVDEQMEVERFSDLARDAEAFALILGIGAAGNLAAFSLCALEIAI